MCQLKICVAGNYYQIKLNKLNDFFEMDLVIFWLQEADNPVDDHAQKLRTIYQLAKEVYDYHFKETRESFYDVHVSGNKLGITHISLLISLVFSFIIIIINNYIIIFILG